MERLTSPATRPARTALVVAFATAPIALLGLLGLLGMGACSSLHRSEEVARLAPAQAGPATQLAPGPAELWAWNCARCHGIQPASRYSDTEWKVVMHHMRLQCYLTGAEQRSIEQLLRSSNN